MDKDMDAFEALEWIAICKRIIKGELVYKDGLIQEMIKERGRK